MEQTDLHAHRTPARLAFADQVLVQLSIMQSIFRPASRREALGKHSKGGRRVSGLKTLTKSLRVRNDAIKSLCSAVRRFRDATLKENCNGDYPQALQALLKALDRAEDVIQS